VREAAVELGRTYPHPLVEHGKARTGALELFRKSRESDK
jgi:hypothetical protein